MFMYKRLWSINNQSIDFYSYLFKKSFRSVSDNKYFLNISNTLYNTKLHNCLNMENSLFESPEIALRMALDRNKNDWTIENLDNELDHYISTFDKYREDCKDPLDRFSYYRKIFIILSTLHFYQILYTL